jgi:hypothetical protein
MSASYRVLKLPLSREHSVFYYYKPFQLLDLKEAQQSSLLDVDPARAVFVCHFLRPIEEAFLRRYFGAVGKISELHLGKFKNAANNKRKRRTVYFAVLVYKAAAHAQQVCTDPKLLQNLVNKALKREAKAQLLEEDQDESEEDDEEAQKRQRMTEGGFTIVEAGAANLQAKTKKQRVSDGLATSMAGIS